jgi:hypothetical protein
MEQLKAILKFFRLADEDGSLSLTSLVLLVVVARFALTPIDMKMDTETLIALLGAIGAYQGKKMIKSRGSSNEMATQIKGLGELITDLSKRTTMIENRVPPKR